MAEPRPGEVVQIYQSQLDKDGLIMSELDCKWYGFDNMTANAMSIELVKAVTVLTEQFAAEQAGVDNLRDAALEAAKVARGTDKRPR